MYKIVKDHPVFKEGEKVMCIQSMPDPPKEFMKYTVIPKEHMIFQINKVVNVMGTICLQLFGVVQIGDNYTPPTCFPEKYFVPYSHLSKKEKEDYDRFYFNVN